MGSLCRARQTEVRKSTRHSIRQKEKVSLPELEITGNTITRESYICSQAQYKRPARSLTKLKLVAYPTAQNYALPVPPQHLPVCLSGCSPVGLTR